MNLEGRRKTLTANYECDLKLQCGSRLVYPPIQTLTAKIITLAYVKKKCVWSRMIFERRELSDGTGFNAAQDICVLWTYTNWRYYRIARLRF